MISQIDTNSTSTRPMLKKEAAAIVGGLSNTSKMPGKSYGIPARECKVGSRLRKVKGSTCSKCYAMKGMYGFKVVQDAQYRRFESLHDAKWEAAMITLITNQKFFRWHDSGDIQTADHFQRIVNVCNATPDTKHWIPTREYQIVMDWVCNGGEIPTNLCVRFSDHMVDKENADMGAKKIGVQVSGVTTKESNRTCPAPMQDGECKDCRRCWDTSSFRVNYKVH